jgi:hypothetical protein
VIWFSTDHLSSTSILTINPGFFMDHRCLYGHRVPATFAFAIQNRVCPMCGASTVTVTGYQVARKLASEASLDAMAAFNIIKVIESEWSFTPLNESAEAPATEPVAQNTAPAITVPPPRLSEPAPSSNPDPVIVASMVEELVVEEALVEGEEVIAAPEPKVARPAPVAVLSMNSVAAVPVPPPSPVNITARVSRSQPKPAFDAKDEDFFKCT